MNTHLGLLFSKDQITIIAQNVAYHFSDLVEDFEKKGHRQILPQYFFEENFEKIF